MSRTSHLCSTRILIAALLGAAVALLLLAGSAHATAITAANEDPCPNVDTSGDTSIPNSSQTEVWVLKTLIQAHNTTVKVLATHCYAKIGAPEVEESFRKALTEGIPDMRFKAKQLGRRLVPKRNGVTVDGLYEVETAPGNLVCKSKPAKRGRVAISAEDPQLRDFLDSSARLASYEHEATGAIVNMRTAINEYRSKPSYENEYRIILTMRVLGTKLGTYLKFAQTFYKSGIFNKHPAFGCTPMMQYMRYSKDRADVLKMVKAMESLARVAPLIHSLINTGSGDLYMLRNADQAANQAGARNTGIWQETDAFVAHVGGPVYNGWVEADSWTGYATGVAGWNNVSRRASDHAEELKRAK